MTTTDDTSGNQRWRERKSTFRRPDEQIDVRRYSVAPIATDTEARAFIELHHYSGTYPAARFRFGLYDLGSLVGVAVFSHPCNDAVLTNVFPDLAIAQATELGRFVLLDEVPGNGETWFLAQAFRQLRGKIAGVVSFSDPVARTTASGEQVFPGHKGTIYQAANARYQNRGTARTLRLLPDARVMSDRAIQKIRAGERGWRPAAAVLEGFGADPLPDIAPSDERRAWLDTWLPRLTRKLRHPGNHRYTWVIDPRARRTAQPYGPDRQYPKAAA
jgi:hypothetical protein